MASSGDIPSATRLLVRERAMWACERCGHQGHEIHHRRPRGMGGTSRREIHSPSNLVYLCHDCHADIESNRDLARLDGWLVPGGVDPASWPIVRINLYGMRVTLDDDGGYGLQDLELEYLTGLE